MATLAGNLRTPDSDAVVEGTITLVATAQREVGGATLVRIAYPIEVEDSTYSKAGIPSGEYDVLERLESDGIHGTEKGYRVVVPEGEGTYSLRGLRDIYTGTPPTPSELEALIAFLQADAAATYAPVDSVPEVYQAYVAANSVAGPVTRVTPLDAIDAYGESTTESVGSNWPATLADLIGVPVTNRGVSGQGAADILTRTGLLRPQLTLSGNAIPASGPVAVTAIDPAKGWRIGGSGSFAYTGTIAGIEGSLNHNMVTEVWTFTRTTPGSAVAVNPGTEFIRKESLTTPYNRMILGTGRNNVLDGTLPLVQDLIGLAVTKIRTQIKKYLIWGVINGTNEPTGHTRHTQIAAFNAAMAAAHGANFYDIRRDFIDNGLEMAGITPTTGDTANIAADCPPPSLMADAIHPNTAGYEVIATLIAEKLLALGWISSITYPEPPAPDPVVLTSDSFNRADTASGVIGSTDAAAGGFPLPWASDAQLQILSNQLGHTTLSSATRFCRVDLAALVASGDFDPADYDLNNYYVEMTVTGGLTDGGVHGRWSDSNNYYSARAQSNGIIALDAKLAGATVPLETTAAGVAVLGDKIGMWVRNEGGTVSLTVYRNRIQILQRLGDTRILTGKKLGIRSSFSNAAARYEDFAVWDRFPGLTP